MTGVITFRHIATNAHIVVAEYGWKVFARCVVAAVRGESRTFLSIVWE
jgi:hypothetical protein